MDLNRRRAAAVIGGEEETQALAWHHTQPHNDVGTIGVQPNGNEGPNDSAGKPREPEAEENFYDCDDQGGEESADIITYICEIDETSWVTQPKNQSLTPLLLNTQDMPYESGAVDSVDVNAFLPDHETSSSPINRAIEIAEMNPEAAVNPVVGREMQPGIGEEVELEVDPVVNGLMETLKLMWAQVPEDDNQRLRAQKLLHYFCSDGLITESDMVWGAMFQYNFHVREVDYHEIGTQFRGLDRETQKPHFLTQLEHMTGPVPVVEPRSKSVDSQSSGDTTVSSLAYSFNSNSEQSNSSSSTSNSESSSNTSNSEPSSSTFNSGQSNSSSTNSDLDYTHHNHLERSFVR